MALTVKPPGFHLLPNKTHRRHVRIPVLCRRATDDACPAAKRRDVLITPLLAVGAYALHSAVAKAVEAPAKEEVINSRIYDATAIGEPLALGKDKRKAWEKMMKARIVYLGEAEQVPTRDDKEVELEIVKSLRKRCLQVERPMSLALEAIPSDLQDHLNRYMDPRSNAEALKSLLTHWPSQRWQEYEPLLTYCRDNGVRLIACGLPLQILRTIQSEGVGGLSKGDRKKYAPPAGSGFITGFPSISRRTSSSSSSLDINFSSPPAPYEPSSYLSIQARVVEDYSMSQTILQAVAEGGSNGMLVVVTGAGHVAYGSRGTGLPARISRKMQKKNQVVILLDPERQYIRREGEVPVADFLWYSAARPCSRNCFDRAEIARVMNAAGTRREALPQDLQNGLDRGLVSPEVLQNFFDLERYPLISELTHRFQGFRERLLADPKFLHRLAIEESISISTTLIAQYQKRKDKFMEELDYVVTDTLRGIVVDFFTVWLPAPTLSFLPVADSIPDSLETLLGSIPDNAFQKNPVGRNWNFNHRIASVVFGGLKLAAVGFVSSIGAVASSNILYALRKLLNPTLAGMEGNKRSPILKSALVYCTFLGTSANLRYQFIAGIVEHRVSDEFSDQPLLVNVISFVARTLNSYWGTQQWIDLARYTGLQASKKEELSFQPAPDASNSAAMECKILEDTNIDEANTQ
ncbi:protein RETICULATA-RELATED 6, chloroplastic-like [Salvia miltiorrhiza]|uniref:protein RETICULATA-RELATED 6, chloroplastic-like n=1 Tax=Salvia miltiorrhiza TaxID=226208 RepID=UPI0025AD7761|nr:protein RETICULATA-RELATED 6, chloroplastic-like [Salvia miltiorrhiza]